MNTLPPPPPDWRDVFEQHVLALQKRMRVPGIGVTLFTPEQILLSEGFGSRDREAGLPVTDDTIFGVASITKSFTALSILKLVSDGALSLDDPVAEYLPFTLWDGGEPARIRHFLSHTSGLPALPTMDWVRSPSQVGDRVTGTQAAVDAEEPVPDVRTPEGLVAWIDANAELLGKPGEHFSYSNDGYCLLGGIVEQVSDQPFDAFVADSILAPLGMTRTTFDLDRVMADPDHSTLYDVDPQGDVQPSPKWETTGRLLGGGMLKSTLADLRSYVRYLMAPDRAAGPDVEPSLVRAMAGAYTWSGPGSRYGYGLASRSGYQGLTLVGHDGSLKGVSSRMGWVPELGLGGVVLCNLAEVPASDLWLAGVNALTGLPIDGKTYAPGTYAASDAEVLPLLGAYASGEPYGLLRLYRNDPGTLRATVGKPPKDVPARMVGPDELALSFPERDAPVTVLREDDGSVLGVHYGSRVLLRQASS